MAPLSHRACPNRHDRPGSGLCYSVGRRLRREHCEVGKGPSLTPCSGGFIRPSSRCPARRDGRPTRASGSRPAARVRSPGPTQPRAGPQERLEDRAGGAAAGLADVDETPTARSPWAAIIQAWVCRPSPSCRTPPCRSSRSPAARARRAARGRCPSVTTPRSIDRSAVASASVSGAAPSGALTSTAVDQPRHHEWPLLHRRDHGGHHHRRGEHRALPDHVGGRLGLGGRRRDAAEVRREAEVVVDARCPGRRRRRRGRAATASGPAR